MSNSNVEICQVAYEGRTSWMEALLKNNPRLLSVTDQVKKKNIQIRSEQTRCFFSALLIQIQGQNFHLVFNARKAIKPLNFVRFDGTLTG